MLGSSLQVIIVRIILESCDCEFECIFITLGFVSNITVVYCRDMDYPGNRQSYDPPHSDHGGQRVAENSFDDRFQNRNNGMNGQPEDSFYRNSPVDVRYKTHSEQYNSLNPEDSFHGIQYVQRPLNDSYREGLGDNTYEDPYRGEQSENRYMDGPPEDRYRDGDRYGEGPPDQYNGPSDVHYQGQPGDQAEDRYEGSQDDQYEGQADNHYGRPQDDRYRRPEDDHYGGPHDDHYGRPEDDRYGGPPQDQYGGSLDDRYANRSDSPVGIPPKDLYKSREANDHYGDLSMENSGLQMNPESMQHDPRLQEMRDSPHPDDHYRDNNNPSFSTVDPYNDFVDGGPTAPHLDSGYRDDEDSFRGPPPTDRYREGPLEGDHLNQYDPNSDSERKHEGLPPVHSDPFADDPFQHGVSALPRDQYRESPIPGDKYGEYME